jgi:hypothetical protein
LKKECSETVIVGTIKTEHAKKWKAVKTNFETNTGSKKPSVSEKKFLTKTFRKGSGIGKSLKSFDSAVKKGHRKTAAEAYQEAWELVNDYMAVLNKAVMALPVDSPVVKEIFTLITSMQSILTSLSDLMCTGKSGHKILLERGSNYEKTTLHNRV